MTQKQLILQKLKDQVRAGRNNALNERGAIVASFIIALSGFILYADKALVFMNLEVVLPQKFADKDFDPDTFVWIVGQTLSPLLIIVGSIMRPYFYAYIIPIYCYILQFYFVLIDFSMVDDGYSYMYSLGITFLLFFIMYFARNASEYSTKLMLEEAKEKIRKAKLEHASD